MASSNQADTNLVAKKSKATKLSRNEQSQRFILAARKLDADEEGLSFDRVIGKIFSENKS